MGTVRALLVEQRITEQLPHERHHVVCDDSVGTYILLATILQMLISSHYQPEFVDAKAGPGHREMPTKRHRDAFSECSCAGSPGFCFPEE